MDLIQHPFGNMPNYSIVEDKAYTEDNVIVYNLFLFKIPVSVNETVLRQHFSTFGDIVLLRVIKKAAPHQNRRRKPNPVTVGFVHFKDPAHACRALRSSPHFVQGQRIGVKACDSWHQPSMAQIACVSVPGVSDSQPLATTILDLNDDCLMEVCSHLELSDMIKFARVCKRFSDVFQVFAKSKYKELNVVYFHALTLWEIRIFFQLVGDTIEMICGNIADLQYRGRVLDLIFSYAPNLKIFACDEVTLKLATARKLCQKLPLLEKILTTDSYIPDCCMKPLKGLKNLRVLSLRSCYELTGRTLRHLTQLTHLMVNDCDLYSGSFITTFRAMPNLVHLNVQRCAGVTAEARTVLASSCKNLETLEITHDDRNDLNWMTQLPKLRTLELYFDPLVSYNMTKLFVKLKKIKLEHLKLIGRDVLTDTCLQHVAEMKTLKYFSSYFSTIVSPLAWRNLTELTDLEELVLMGSSNLTDAVLLQIVRSCPKLRCLQIQRCPEVSWDFVTGCETILKSRYPDAGVTTKSQLKVFAFNSGIYEASFVENISERSPLIEWNFHTQCVIKKDGNADVLLYDPYDDDDSFSDYFDDQFDDEYDSGSDIDVADLDFSLEHRFDMGFMNEEDLLDIWMGF